MPIYGRGEVMPKCTYISPNLNIDLLKNVKDQVKHKKNWYHENLKFSWVMLTGHA